MIKFFVCACVCWFFGVAHACTCDFVPLETATAQAAKDVFIFRLISAQVRSGGNNEFLGARIEGEIQIVDRLRGHGTFRTMKFSTGACCGSRFDVGAYFAAFISERGPEFSAHRENVVELTQAYSLLEARKKIGAILGGHTKLEKVFSRDDRNRTEQSPVPPPCPRERSEAKP